MMSDLRDAWTRHHALERVRPMIIVQPEGSWAELIPERTLQCEDDAARAYEIELRRRCYYWDHIRDDTVIENIWVVQKVVHSTGWGLEPQWIGSDQTRGAGTYKPVIESREDLKKLHFPEISYDEAATRRNLEQAQELFGDILDVQLKGIRTVSFHLMNLYTHLRGLDQVMMDMYEQPEMLHEAMSFLEQGHHRLIDQYEELNLLSLNNDNSYVYPSGNGFSDELPQPDHDPDHVRPRDMWATAEAQELTLVSPEMTNGFAIEYEKKLLSRFGLTCYGCCEDLTRKLDYVFTIPHLRQVNISPFADVEKCAEQFQSKDLIFAWKPHPSQIVGDFNEDAVRANIRRALDVTRGLVFEIALKDTHTCDNHPERFTRWVEIAREACDDY